MRSHTLRSTAQPRRVAMALGLTAASLVGVTSTAGAATVGQASGSLPSICRNDPDCPEVVDTSGAVAALAAAPTTGAPPVVEDTALTSVAPGGVPARVANGPANPANPESGSLLTRGVRLLSRADALDVRAYVFPSRPTHHRAIAPHTTSTGLGDGRILFRTNQAARMVVNVPASTLFDIRIKVGGRWFALGSAISDEQGWLGLPVVSIARPGSYLVSLYDTRRASLAYVKLDVRR